MNDLGHYRILIVDDTKTNLDVLIQALKSDYRLGVALNGFKALDYVRENRPDLILLDILMPGMDGFEVCRTIKADADTCDIPIIFISAMEDTDHITQGFEMGAVDYITKPFDITEVKARVKTHLMLRFAQNALKNQNAILEEKVRERTRELEKTQIEILERLEKAAEYRGRKSDSYVNRMIAFCRLLGNAVGLSPVECQRMALASVMHDVGKIGIPDTILMKSDDLTAEECEIMKTHTRIGAKILSGSENPLLKMAEIIALTHHERWDGSGYPNGLAGEAIPLPGRIVCVCEAFGTFLAGLPDEATAIRVQKALDHIKAGSGSRFDPQLISGFVALEQKLTAAVETVELVKQT